MGINNPAPTVSGNSAAIAPRPAGSGKLVSDDLPVSHLRHNARLRPSAGILTFYSILLTHTKAGSKGTFSKRISCSSSNPVRVASLWSAAAQLRQLQLTQVGNGSQSNACFARLPRLKVDSKTVQTDETTFPDLAAIARRVCWWEPAASTLENTPLLLCRIMALGTWDDICVALDHYGRDAFREALRNAPPGLFDARSWHYWHHRLQLLPVPSLPQRAIPA